MTIYRAFHLLSENHKQLTETLRCGGARRIDTLHDLLEVRVDLLAAPHQTR